MSLPPDFIQDLKSSIAGQVRLDPVSRRLYSTDASIYQIEPLGVVFPRELDDLPAIVALAAQYRVPLLARGAGSSLAGQAIGPALIVDCSRHLYRQLEIDPAEGTATVAPGVIVESLNRAATPYGLQFGPDPASAERATMAGSIANNASGAHSILYGMAADHLLSAEVVLADGSLAVFEEVGLEGAHRIAAQELALGASAVPAGHPQAVASATLSPGSPLSRRPGSPQLISNLYAAALNIRTNYADAIRQNWPRTWRRASGYNLNYLIPWSPTAPPEWRLSPIPYPPVSPESINLAPLLAGSEGTLALIRRMTVRLVPRPRHTVLGVLAYPSLAAACDAVPDLLDRHPAAVELIPENLIRLARSVPAYAQQLDFLEQLAVHGIPAALLVVEFAGDDPARLRAQAQDLGPEVLIAESASAQKQVWGIRKVGLGILTSQPGDLRGVTFIEDLAVPVENLGQFVREMERIMAEHGTRGDFYAHASAGCLHMRPILNIKEPQGLAAMRAIATQAVELVLRLGGTATGEHGDGLARSEWLARTYGPEVIRGFRELKQAADPLGILNPGKILDAPPMDSNLRFEEGYHPRGWRTALDFSNQAGLVGAVELCNGAGVCRKEDGVMCPSFQVTREEMHSTRGRANLLQALLSSDLPSAHLPNALNAAGIWEKAVFEALDLCLACKGCKAECPSAVDMAKLKYEFINEYYKTYRRRLRDYLFGYIGLVARLGSPFAPLANLVLGSPLFSRLADPLLGLSRNRPFPQLARQSLTSLLRQLPLTESQHSTITHQQSAILFLSDPFTEYFHPQAGEAAVHALQAAGCQVQVLPVLGAGRTLISKGFIEPARRHAARLLEAIRRLDPQGAIPVVGVEPSEIIALRDEYLDLFPGDEYVRSLSRRAWMVDEFLIRPDLEGNPRIAKIMGSLSPNSKPKVLLHGHCYQKAQPPAPDGHPTGVIATVAMLAAAGYQVEVIDAGCCGMAGAFGYESEHYDLSMKVGEMALLPAVRAAADGVIVAAAGASCQAQIEDGAGKPPVHPITLIPINIP